MKYLAFLLVGFLIIGCSDNNLGPLDHKIDTDFKISFSETTDSLILIVKSEKEYMGQFNKANYSLEHLSPSHLALTLNSLHLCDVCQRISGPTYNRIIIGPKSIDKYTIDIKVKRKTQQVTYENGKLSIDKKGSIKIEKD
jgi:hypothetical protein